MVELKLNFSKLSEKPKFIKMLVYGKPGVGKTIFSSSAPSPILVDIERGTLSLQNEDLKKKGIVPEDIDVFPIEEFIQMNDVFEYLKDGNHSFKTVIIDSLTSLQQRSMDTIMEEGTSKKPEKDPDLSTQNDWGVNTAQIKKVIRYFRNLPMNVIFTCLAKDYTNEEGVILTSPAISPSILDVACAYTDIVGYMFTAGKEAETRAMLFQPTERYYAKDRSGKLGKTMVDPSFSKVLEIINK